IAERTEQAYGVRAGEIAAKLAVHFERGREELRAARYLRDATESALKRHGDKEVADHLHRRLELLAAVPETAETVALRLEARPDWRRARRSSRSAGWWASTARRSAARSPRREISRRGAGIPTSSRRCSSTTARRAPSAASSTSTAPPSRRRWHARRKPSIRR